ncbi:MAG: ferrous iron transport protein B, partial [Sphingobacteriia bacterium]|nr:ferrous iron transport protein B [Sphingobacteriia bacterium]
GIPQERMADFERRGAEAVVAFEQALAGNAYARIATPANITPLVNYFNDYKRAKLNAAGASGSQAVDAHFEQRHPEFFPLVSPPKGDKDARQASRALRDLDSARKTLRREMKEERITNSLLGMIGRGLEPVTQFAGFDWKINVALLSSFAARESSVATLGVLFQQDEDQNASLEARMGAETKAAGATSLLGTAIILFFALYPPCLATTVMVKVQTDSYKWMVFSIVFPTLLGLGVASAVYSIGLATGASGIEMMTWTYFSALALLLILGLFGGRDGRARRPVLESPADGGLRA